MKSKQIRKKNRRIRKTNTKTKSKTSNKTNTKTRKTKKQKGGYLCSSDNPKDIYNLGPKYGSGEEGVVYLDESNENVIIKEYFKIILKNQDEGEEQEHEHEDKFEEHKEHKFEEIFKLYTLLGEQGIGPKIYFYDICKKTFNVNLKTISSFNRAKLAAMFSGEYASLIRTTKTQPNGEDYIFSYEAIVPYLVMERIHGQPITDSELDLSSELIYKMYADLYSQDIILFDLHKDNILITKTNRIYFIDSNPIQTEKKPELLSKIEFIQQIKARTFNA
jgi:hypothetical protein